jgi:hypothetical protein
MIRFPGNFCYINKLYFIKNKHTFLLLFLLSPYYLKLILFHGATLLLLMFLIANNSKWYQRDNNR